MNTLTNTNRVPRVRATAGDELGLLVNLLRNETIGYRMLLRNVAEIAADDYELVIKAVLILTDKDKIRASRVTQLEFEDALVAVRVADDFKGKESIVAAISDAMQLDW